MKAPHALTDHAIDRYLERWRQDLSREDATQELRGQLALAVFIEHPPGEDAIWRTPCGALLVVREDGVVATVLPVGAQRTDRRPRR
jgi:hypothetical protein